MKLIDFILPENDKRRLQLFKYKWCLRFKILVRKIDDLLCLTKEEKIELENMVEQTKKDAMNFKNIQEHVPRLYDAINEMNTTNVKQGDNIDYLWMMIEKIYIADKSGDEKLKFSLFKELGFEKKID